MYGGDGITMNFYNPDFDFVRGDIRNPDIVKKSLEDMDIIIHLAAIVGYPACKKDPRLAEEVNYEGTLNLDSLRKRDQLVIFASTGSNYGALPKGQVATETTPLNPLTIYGKTKTRAERHLGESGNFIIFRFSTGFGFSPRMRLDLLINDFVYQAVKSKQLIVYEKTFRRSFIHVQDMARSFLFAIDNIEKMRDEIYNVGSEKLNLSKEDVANYIREKVDYFLYFADIGEDEDKRNYEISFEKIRKAGFETEVSFEEGVNELIRGMEVIEIHNRFSNV